VNARIAAIGAVFLSAWDDVQGNICKLFQKQVIWARYAVNQEVGLQVLSVRFGCTDAPPHDRAPRRRKQRAREAEAFRRVSLEGTGSSWIW